MDHIVEKSVREFLVGTAGVDAGLLDEPQRKVTELGLDSLGIVELLFEVEDKFGIRVDDPMTIKDFTLQQLFAFFGEQLAAKANAGATVAIEAAGHA